MLWWTGASQLSAQRFSVLRQERRAALSTLQVRDIPAAGGVANFSKAFSQAKGHEFQKFILWNGLVFSGPVLWGYGVFSCVFGSPVGHQFCLHTSYPPQLTGALGLEHGASPRMRDMICFRHKTMLFIHLLCFYTTNVLLFESNLVQLRYLMIWDFVLSGPNLSVSGID